MLSAYDCFELGRQSYNNRGNIDTIIMWMTLAIKQWDSEAKKSVQKVT